MRDEQVRVRVWVRGRVRLRFRVRVRVRLWLRPRLRLRLRLSRSLASSHRPSPRPSLKPILNSHLHPHPSLSQVSQIFFNCLVTELFVAATFNDTSTTTMPTCVWNATASINASNANATYEVVRVGDLRG